MFPNKSFYVIEYNIVQNSYAYYQVSDQKGVPLVTGPIQLFDLFGLGAITSSDARFFAIQFYDPLSNGTDPDNVTRISVLNKAYEIKKVIEKIKSITNVTSVNVVAHSMGGLDARTYVENLASAGSCYDYQDNLLDPAYGSHPNYAASTCLPGTPKAAFANDVANIITVDTPHSGSPLAALQFKSPGQGLGLLATSFGQECQAFDSTNKTELALSSDGGPGLIEELNYEGSIHFGVAPILNSVPVQAVSNYFGDSNLSWTLLTGESDDIVPIDSQAFPNLLSLDNTAPFLNTPFSHAGGDPEVFLNSDCWVLSPSRLMPMLHSMKCLGALSAPQTQIERQLEKNNWLWVTSWTNPQTSIPLNQGVKIEYSAVDYGSSLSSVRLWRAPDNNGQPGTWALMPDVPDLGSTLAGGSFTNKPSAPGTYWYDVDVLDSSNNEAREPLWFKVTFTAASTYALTVSTIGNGTVTSSDGYINCGSSCTHTYSSGFSVTLSAVPLSGWNFSGWSGACRGTVACTVTMSAATTATATFSQNAANYALTVSTIGSGTVKSSDGYINCGSSCTHTYSSGFSVTLNPTPASGWSFSGWSGACNGDIGSCALTMSAARTTTATFTQNAANNVPLAATGAPSAITTNSATLNGTVNPEGLDTHYYFLYGTNSSLSGAGTYQTPSMDIGHGTTSTTISAPPITGLSGGTLYYCKLVASNSAGTTGGGTISFATTSTVQIPTATTGSAGSVTATSATLGGTVNPNGGDTHYWFLYGTSSSLSGALTTQSVDFGTGTIAYSISANIFGLSAGTKYFYQLVASNSAGTGYGLPEVVPVV